VIQDKAWLSLFLTGCPWNDTYEASFLGKFFFLSWIKLHLPWGRPVNFIFVAWSTIPRLSSTTWRCETLMHCISHWISVGINLVDKCQRTLIYYGCNFSWSLLSMRSYVLILRNTNSFLLYWEVRGIFCKLALIIIVRVSIIAWSGINLSKSRELPISPSPPSPPSLPSITKYHQVTRTKSVSTQCSDFRQSYHNILW